MVFLHGALGSRGIFSVYQVPALSKHFHILNMDIPGHGSRMGQRLSLDAAVETVAEVIRTRAHGGKAIVILYFDLQM